MLGKAVGGLRRVGRTKRTVTLVGILLLLLGLMTVAVVLAADPDVDGDVEGDSGWQAIDIVRTDPAEGSIPDEYDMEDVYMRSSDDNLTFYGGLVVYSDTIVMNQGAYISFGFDTDWPSTTGGPVDSGACPDIGAEYRLRYYYDYGWSRWDEILQYWNGSDFVPRAEALGDHGPNWEAAIQYYAIGLTETQCISIGIHFENAAVEDDDSVCDITWCYTDGVTAVDLSSFTDSSEGSDNPIMQPGILALLALGLAFVAFGGLVLWRGRALAR